LNHLPGAEIRVRIRGARSLSQHVDSSHSPTEALLVEVGFVHRLARALLRDDGLAHDVAQDALTAALQQQPVLYVRGWLDAVTRRLASRAGRDARERALREAHAARPLSSDGEARTAERLRLHRRLCDAVVALPEPYRTAVTLRFFDELPPRAIARRLGVPAATVWQRVHRGLAMLRQQLDREFGGEGERNGWRGAFAAAGLGKTTVSVLPWLLPVLAMKKVVIGAALAAVLVVGWWTWPRGDAPPVVTQVANAPTSPAAAPVAGNATATNETKVEAVRTAAAPAPRNEAFMVRVVDERAQPIADADVHRWTAAGATSKQGTDRDGRAEFGALDEGGGLVVRADGWTPLVRELESLRGAVTCTLIDGAVLDGTMLVDGVPAPAGLRLRFRSNPALPKSAPRELRETFDANRPRCVAVTAAGGTFSMRGSPAGQRVTIDLPPTHWFVPENDADVQAWPQQRAFLPAPGVVLRTTQLPTVYGRVVWADDGSPVCEPRVGVVATFADGAESPSTGCWGEADGSFAKGVYPMDRSKWQRWGDPTKRAALTQVQLYVDGPGTDGTHFVALDKKALAAMPVEVRLPRAAVTHFVVTDLDDHPIAGARVSAKPSTVTDEHGHGTFQANRDLVLVGADGCQVQPAVSARPAAGTESDPLRFRLAPRNQLVLRVRMPDGSVPPIRCVEITSSAAMFQGHRDHRTPFDQTFGGSEGKSSVSVRLQTDGRREMLMVCTVPADASGDITLHSFEPGMSCTANASSGLGDVVASVSFTTPRHGETITRDLVVDATPRSLRGRVVARDGSSIPNAKVTVRREEGSAGLMSKARDSLDVRPGADGAFTLGGVYTRGPLTLMAKAAGYAEAQKEIAAVDEADEHVLVLEPAQRVTLRVVDEAGRPVEVGARAEQIAGRRLQGQKLQAGEHLFTDLPPGIVTFEVAFGGAKFRVRHDTANPNATMLVPRPGCLVVGLKKGDAMNLVARATRLDAAGEPFDLRVGAGDAEGELVVPGRYRVELIRYSRRGQGEKVIEEVAAPAQEIEAKAGELVRVVF
jgi:RNA polymerase sigma-70 factor (ECF subfamily)